MASRQYEIHIKGHLSHDWADWLDCMHMCILSFHEMDAKATGQAAGNEPARETKVE